MAAKAAGRPNALAKARGWSDKKRDDKVYASLFRHLVNHELTHGDRKFIGLRLQCCRRRG
jgi:hypothetical protein